MPEDHQLRRTRETMRVCAAPGLALCLLLVSANAAFGQSAASVRLSILQAEGRRTGSAQDLLVIRNGLRSPNADTAQVAVRALGRFERPSLIPSILGALRHASPDVRREAANAVAQAARGFRTETRPVAVTVQSVQASLAARLNVEADPEVRAVLCEALARLPYTRPADVVEVETALVGFSPRGVTPTERVGLAKSLEILVRVHGAVRQPGGETIGLLTSLFRQSAAAPPQDALREARVRRLALEGLAQANAVSEEVVDLATRDPDPQVRRLGMKAAASRSGMARLRDGLLDPTPAVRLEALRALHQRDAEGTCDASLRAITDSDMAVVLIAIDQLGACGRVPEAVGRLEQMVADVSEMDAPRGWHRNAHALLALAAAAPDRVDVALPSYAKASNWQLRLSAVRAASRLGNRALLETLNEDSDPRVADAARAGLGLPARPAARQPAPVPAPLTGAELARLSTPRARMTIRDVGTIEIALLTSQAPATAVEFSRLADAGYYNGTTFDLVEPNVLLRTSESGRRAASYPAGEPGVWPHVRGTVSALATGAPGAAFFINVVDNQRLDHDATVFGQVLNGLDVVDRIMDGDVIESIEILP